MTAEELKELLHYDPETGVFTWRKKPSRRVHAGDVAGTINSCGYRNIRIKKKDYAASRLAWLYVTGEHPEGVITHLNLDRGDDTFSNLQCVSMSIALARVGERMCNSSGLKGVSFDKRTGKWRADIRAGGRLKSLGRYRTRQEAAEVYAEAADAVHGEFSHFYRGWK